jgi:hypothetical protein
MEKVKVGFPIELERTTLIKMAASTLLALGICAGMGSILITESQAEQEYKQAIVAYKAGDTTKGDSLTLEADQNSNQGTLLIVAAAGLGSVGAIGGVSLIRPLRHS